MATKFENLPDSPQPDEALLEVLKETDLDAFATKLCVNLQLTRLDHFDHITDSELESCGLSIPAIRRLRAAIDERRKKSSKIKSFFRGKDKLTSSFRQSNDKGERSLNHNRKKPEHHHRSHREGPSDGGGVTCLISKEEIKLFEKIGEGSFAVVRRAVWTQGHTKKDVAVKLLRDSASFSEELQQEVDHMYHLRHSNLIRLHGLVFARPIMMVVELCDGGALLDRLRESQKPVLLAAQLVAYSLQIARGMAYLEAKRFIHRDLAARNVLLTADEKQIKIGDFGLMRALPDKDEHYVMSGQKKVPFAWCPPESLKRRQFSHASDVWSFGVTLWEMFSYGEEPWCGFRGPEILQKVLAGERLCKPVCCPSSLYQLTLQCWALEPEQRPRFLALKDLLKEFVCQSVTNNADKLISHERLLSDLTLASQLAKQMGIFQQQLSTGECKEAQSGEGFLEMQVGDRIVVIEGCPEQYYWYGQSCRTRKFGKFPRKNFVFLGKKSGKDISAPIKGSFIHAGHGDARGGESWGNPEKIDPIILNNPMPEAVLIELGGEEGTTPTESRPTGAEVIPSVMQLSGRSSSGAPISTPTRHQSESSFLRPSRPPPPGNRPVSDQGAGGGSSGGSSNSPFMGVQEEEEVDPFAPFPYDDLESTYSGPPGSRGAYYDAVAPSTYYGRVPDDSGYATQVSAASEHAVYQNSVPFPPSPNRPSANSAHPTPSLPASTVPPSLPIPSSTGFSPPLATGASSANTSQAQSTAIVPPTSNWRENFANGPSSVQAASTAVTNTSFSSGGRMSPPKLPRLPAPAPSPKRSQNRTASGSSLQSPSSSGNLHQMSSANQSGPGIPSSTNQAGVSSANRSGAGFSASTNHVGAGISTSANQISGIKISPNFGANSTTVTETKLRSVSPRDANIAIPTIAASTSTAAVTRPQASTEPDPFEIPETALDMVNRPRYSQVYQKGAQGSTRNSVTLAQPTSVPLSQPTSARPSASPTSLNSRLPNQSEGRPPNSNTDQNQQVRSFTVQPTQADQLMSQLNNRLSQMTAKMETLEKGHTIAAHSRPAAINAYSASSLRPSSANSVPFQARPPQTSTSDYGSISAQGYGGVTTASRPASFAATAFPPAPIASAAAHGAAGGWRSSTPTAAGPPLVSLAGSQLRPSGPSLGEQLRASSVPDVSPAVLDLFDPLTSKAPSNLIQEVMREAPFATSTERCSVVLRRCGMDVAATVKELKVQKLMDTGIAGDREKAILALDKVGWDVNAAAESLLG